MKPITVLIIITLLAGSALNAMPIPSQPAEEEMPVIHSGGAAVPDWGRTWGWVGLGCAAIGTVLLVDGSDGNNTAGAVLLLPGIAWLAFFGH